MKRYERGDKAPKGTYVNVRTGEFVTHAPDGGALPDAAAGFIRVPIGLVLVAGPILGLAYIIFLPLAGLGSLVMLAAHKLLGSRPATADQESEG